MADSKITALTSISTSTDPANDPLVIVDVSDTSMAASGTTKKVTLNNLLACSPTATLASATITGAATVGTTLGVTGASTFTGSVGIGAASSAKLSVTDANGIPIRFGDLAAAPASQTACYVGTSTSAFSGNGNGDLILVPRTTDARDVVVYTGSGTAADRLRVTAAGNVNITTGNVVIGTSGKGIDFSAVTGGTGTATANVLNDYEEGTFTPSIGGTATYTTQTGRYTKVGDRVFVTMRLTVLLVGTGSTDTISGLPFTVGSLASPVYVGYFANLALSPIYISGYANNASSTVTMTGVTTASATITNGFAVIGNTADLVISFFYEV